MKKKKNLDFLPHATELSKHWYENVVFCIFYLITLFSDAISNFSSLTFPKILLALSWGFK